MKCLNKKLPIVKEFLKVCPREAVLADILDRFEGIPTIAQVAEAYEDYKRSVGTQGNLFKAALSELGENSGNSKQPAKQQKLMLNSVAFPTNVKGYITREEIENSFEKSDSYRRSIFEAAGVDYDQLLEDEDIVKKFKSSEVKNSPLDRGIAIGLYDEKEDVYKELQNIIDNSTNHIFVELASKFIKLESLKDVKMANIVLSKENHEERLGILGSYYPQYEKFNINRAGIKEIQRIYLENPEIKGAQYGKHLLEGTILHELIHYLTVQELYYNKDFNKNIRKLFNYAKFALDGTGHYGLTNILEFVTESLTNPEFQIALKNREVGDLFLNISPTKATNLFDSLLELIAKVFGAKKSLLEYVIKETAVIIEAHEERKRNKSVRPENIKRVVSLYSNFLNTKFTSQDDFYNNVRNRADEVEQFKKFVEQYKDVTFSQGTIIDNLGNIAAQKKAVELTRLYPGTYTSSTADEIIFKLREENPDIFIERRDFNVNGRWNSTITFKPKATDRKALDILTAQLQAKFPSIKVKEISEAEAVEMKGSLGRTANAFIIGDTIYTVTGKITDEVLMEEFFHPFIEAIFQNNKPLFDNLLLQSEFLYADLKEKIKKTYSSFSEEDRNKELVTQALAKAFKKDYNENGTVNAAGAIYRMKALVKDFLKWVDSVFNTNFVTAGLIPETVKLRDLAVLLNTGGLTFEAALTNRAMYNQQSFSTVPSNPMYEKLEALSKDVELSPDEKFYTVKGSAYARLTEWVREFFNKGNANKLSNTKEFAEAAVKKIFNSLPNVNGKVKYNGKEYTEDELVLEKMKEFNYSSAIGRVIHGLIELYNNNADGKPTSRIEAQIKKDAEAKPDQEEVNVSSFQWILKVIPKVYNELGITAFDTKIKEAYRDKMLTENYLYSDILKIATKADNTIVHPNGAISIIDWKTGNKFLDSRTVGDLVGKIAEYSSLIKNNRVDKAKIEVMLRAMIIKENIPEAYFKRLVVAHISKYNNTYFDVNVEDYLNLFNDFFLKNAPDLHEKLKAKGLFDSNSYGTEPSITEAPVIEDNAKALNNLEAEAIALNAQIEKTRNAATKATLQMKLEKVSKEIMNRNFGINIDTIREDSDLGIGQALFGNFYSVNNKVIQLFNRIFTRGKKSYEVKKKELFDKFDVIQRKLMLEWRSKNPGLIVDYYNEKGTGLYNFLWVKKSRGTDFSGFYKVTKTDPEYQNLTAVQKEYIDFITIHMNEAYKANVNKEVDGYNNTYANYLNLAAQLDDSFMPRVRMADGEVTEHFGLISSQTSRKLFNNLNETFLKYEQRGLEADGMPIKFLEHPEIVENEYHSFNAELAFKKFMDHLLYRDEMDSVYALGKGIAVNLRSNSHGLPLEKAAQFLEDRMVMDILKMNKMTKYTTKPVRILGYYVHVDKFLDLLRSLVTKSSMILKPASGLRNMFLITLLNWKRAKIGSIAKAAGVPEDQIDFTIEDMAKSYGIVLKNWFENLFSKDKGFDTTKLGLLLRHLNYRPENYDYLSSKESILSEKTRALTGKKEMSSYLYVFHKLGEDLGTDALLVAQLLRMKNHKTGKSMWDSYDVVNGELVWNGGTRGQDNRGNQITGISPEEEIKLKRASQLIHGSYRNEEKMAAEMYAIGRWGMTFKKYLPQIMMNLYQGRYDDSSIGKYDITKENGKDIMVWKSEINEGRIHLLLKHISARVGAVSGNPMYKWENLSGRQKTELIDLYSTVGSYIAMFIAVISAFDDDEDKNNWWYQNAVRLREDISQGLSPIDFIGATRNPFIIMEKVSQITDAYYTYLGEGLLMGEVNQDGRTKGMTQMMKVTPGFSALYEIERLTKDTDQELRFFYDLYNK